MSWTKTLKSVAVISMLTFSLAACNGEVGTISPQEIIENVVKENKEPISYYAESTSTLGDGSSLSMKEWRENTGKMRVEIADSNGENSYSVNDGLKVSTYSTETNEVFTFDLQTLGEEAMNNSPSEQAKMLIKAIEDTHNIEIIGNEKLLKRDVIHVKATPNEQGSNLFGEFEMWIDKETWFVLKNTVTIDGEVTTQEYTKFEMNPTFENDIFTFEQPEGAEIVNFDELSEEIVLKDVKEATQYIEKPFYYVEDQNDVQLNDITVFTMEEISAQLTFNYINKGLPYFSLMVTPVEEENKEYQGEGINVRGQEATLDEFGEFRSISWVQDGIGYTVLIESVDVTTDEVLQLLESMVMN